VGSVWRGEMMVDDNIKRLSGEAVRRIEFIISGDCVEGM
jgi:hypothetical protein